MVGGKKGVKNEKKKKKHTTPLVVSLDLQETVREVMWSAHGGINLLCLF